MNDTLFFNDSVVRNLESESLYRHRLDEADDNTWDDYIAGLNDANGQAQPAPQAQTQQTPTTMQGMKPRRVMKKFNNSAFEDKYIKNRNFSDVEEILRRYGAKEFPNPFDAHAKDILAMFGELHDLKHDANEARTILSRAKSEISGSFDTLYAHAIYGKHDGDGIENAKNLQKISELLKPEMTDEIFGEIAKTVYGNDMKTAQQDMTAMYNAYRTNGAWKAARQDMERFLYSEN